MGQRNYTRKRKNVGLTSLLFSKDSSATERSGSWNVDIANTMSCDIQSAPYSNILPAAFRIFAFSQATFTTALTGLAKYLHGLILTRLRNTVFRCYTLPNFTDQRNQNYQYSVLLHLKRSSITSPRWIRTATLWCT